MRWQLEEYTLEQHDTEQDADTDAQRHNDRPVFDLLYTGPKLAAAQPSERSTHSRQHSDPQAAANDPLLCRLCPPIREFVIRSRSYL